MDSQGRLTLNGFTSDVPRTVSYLPLVLSDLLVSRLAYGSPLLIKIEEGSPVQKAGKHLPEIQAFAFQGQP